MTLKMLKMPIKEHFFVKKRCISGCRCIIKCEGSLKKSAQPGMKTGDWKNQRRMSSVNRISTCGFIE
jgi:hypothetical protein